MSPAASAPSLQLARRAAALCHEMKAQDVVVLDVKGDRGTLSYRSQVPLAAAIGANDSPTLPDVESFVADMHRQGFYLIARIVVFKDDLLARNGPRAGLLTDRPRTRTHRRRYNPIGARYGFRTSPRPTGERFMSQAIVDPGELRRFAANLKRFNADLQVGLAGLHGQLVGLGDTWRDQEHDRFRQEFEQTMQALERFIEVSGEHIPFLLRKAERIEEYLSQR